jgi:peptidoglycan/LPS O-acetylase OafA/YrhL
MQDFHKYLKRSQIYLFAWIVVACFLASSVVITNGGVSDFGMYYSTLPFYTLAFVGGAVNIWFAANSLKKMSIKYKALAVYLNILSILLILVFALPKVIEKDTK